MAAHKYIVCSLTFESEIELPELISAESDFCDISIILGQVPNSLSSPTGSGVLFQVTRQEFLIRIPQVASYYVQNGSRITIQPDDNALEEDIRLFLLGSVLGAVIYQRGLIPIHGSSIVIKQEGMIISGLSSSGKSTLAAGLSKRGYGLLSDDVSVLKNQNHRFMIQPGIPHLKLWLDVIEQLKITENLIRLRPTLEKYRHNIGPYFHQEPKALTKLVFLEIKNSTGITYEVVEGIKKFDLVRSSMYRRQYLTAMGLDVTYFRDLTQLSNSIEVYRLLRPSYPLIIDELAEFVEKKIMVRNPVK